MNVELNKAIFQARELLNRLGRASTPPVRDRGLRLQTHPFLAGDTPHYSVVVIGESEFLTEHGINCLDAHPNNIRSVVERCQGNDALVVNAAAMSGPWKGADTGWAAWKTSLIDEACDSFRSAGLPVFLIRPQHKTAAFIQWATLATAIFPDFEDTSEKTGNPQTDLWYALMNWGNR